MFKKKATLAIAMASLIVLIAPFAIQLAAQVWTCADLPSACWQTTTRGCAGDVMYFNDSCHMYCQTGITVTPAVHCHRTVIVIKEPADAVD